MSWYLECFRKYATFSGRARRKEYWYFALFNLIVSIVLTIVDRVIGSSAGGGSFGLLGGIYSLAILIPSIAVQIRRLHDTNRSGWWIFIGLIPLIGTIVFIVFMVQDSNPGENRFGPNPKENSITGMP